MFNATLTPTADLLVIASTHPDQDVRYSARREAIRRHDPDTCRAFVETSCETCEAIIHASRVDMGLEPVGCAFESVGECETARERSVAGVSDVIPACPVHGAYVEPDDDGPGRDTKGAPADDHRAEPVETALGVLVCAVCDKPVRTAFGGQYPIHASVR